MEKYYNKISKILKLPDDFNDEIKDIPTDVKQIILPFYYNHNLKLNFKIGRTNCNNPHCPKNLPQTLTHLELGYIFYHKINCLPDSLTHLTFPSNHIVNIINLHSSYACDKNTNSIKLPPNLTYLNFNCSFNEEIGHADCADKKCPRNLPSSLTELILSYNFNQIVDNLPKNIINLVFGYIFNQTVDKLPNKITHLTFGGLFNKKIDKLPNSITHLTFGEYFNKNIEILPKSITHLVLGRCFNQTVLKLPNTITDLKIYELSKNSSEDELCSRTNIKSKINSKMKINIFKNSLNSIKNLTIEIADVNLLPDTVKELTIIDELKQFHKLPSELTYIKFNDKFNDLIGHQGCTDSQIVPFHKPNIKNKCPQNLPLTLTHLILGDSFNENVDFLPHNIKVIIFGENFNCSVDLLPNSLTHLTFGSNFNQKVDKLPKLITHLTLGKNFNQPTEFLPDSITNLIFGFNFNNLLKLPKNIAYLELGFKFSKKTIDGFEISNNLKEIKLFYCSKIIKNIPCFIETVNICYKKIQPKIDKNYDISNLPISVSTIKIDNDELLKFIKKIPYNCIIYNQYDNPII